MQSCIVQAIEVVPGINGIEPPWLIMEWIPLDLRSLTLADDEIPILLQQVGSGLAFMHANSVTHRDLKPENILVYQHAGSFSAKIADVGLSKYNVRGKMQSYAGSTAYMAPEFWEPERAYTSAIDVWSFGVVALELLTAWEDLLEQTNATVQLNRSWNQNWVRNIVIPRVDLASEAFKPLLRNLLCEAPEDRWTASECDEWLQEHRSDVGSSQAECRDWREPLFDEEQRRRRSAHPTLSATRAEREQPFPRGGMPVNTTRDSSGV